MAGILIAGVICFTQVFYFHLSNDLKQSTESTQRTNSNSGDDEFISIPSSYSLPASTYLNLEHEFSFIEELLFNREETENAPVTIPLTAGRLFRTLFQFIISPNAP